MYTVLLLTEEHLQKCVYFFAASCSMRDLSFPARDQTQIPAVEAQSLNPCITREVPAQVF